jgi:hypothetical protein
LADSENADITASIEVLYTLMIFPGLNKKKEKARINTLFNEAKINNIKVHIAQH